MLNCVVCVAAIREKSRIPDAIYMYVVNTTDYICLVKLLFYNFIRDLREYDKIRNVKLTDSFKFTIATGIVRPPKRLCCLL